MVLDSHAMLAFLCGDPGSEAIAKALEGPTVMSAFSALEIARALPETNPRELSTTLAKLGVQLVPLDGTMALELGALPTHEAEARIVATLSRTKGLKSVTHGA